MFVNADSKCVRPLQNVQNPQRKRKKNRKTRWSHRKLQLHFCRPVFTKADRFDISKPTWQLREHTLRKAVIAFQLVIWTPESHPGKLKVTWRLLLHNAAQWHIDRWLLLTTALKPSFQFSPLFNLTVSPMQTPGWIPLPVTVPLGDHI